MGKKFNFTGTCIPEKHYMVDTTAKITAIIKLLAEEQYFTINYPRQFGKSTTLASLAKRLRELGYIVIKISFEGLGQNAFTDEAKFIGLFIRLIKKQFAIHQVHEGNAFIDKFPSLTGLEDLSELITGLISALGRELVLLIDEVDRSSNNDLFLYFLGMLRNKYLARSEGEDLTFKSVVLAGVHDVKSLKMKIREDGEAKYNSPWNIAQNLPIDLSFSPEEIETMLASYSEDRKIVMDLPAIAVRLHHFTSGHPFLVSRLCALIDQDIMQTGNPTWFPEYIDQAVDLILREDNTNFESLIKNLENNADLYSLVEKILLDDTRMVYSEDNRVIKKGMTHGIFRKNEKSLEIHQKESGSPYHEPKECDVFPLFLRNNRQNYFLLDIHNLIYKERIYNYLSLNLKIKTLLNRKLDNYNFDSRFLLPDNTLDFARILLRFQAFMKEQYSAKDKEFVERNWRLLFLAFIKPVINGHGFDFKEVQISEEKRLDVVITFYNKKYIAELKIWRGPEKHKQGLAQLADYLKRQNMKEGFLVIFDFNREPDYKEEKIVIDGRGIFIVWV